MVAPKVRYYTLGQNQRVIQGFGPSEIHERFVDGSDDPALSASGEMLQ